MNYCFIFGHEPWLLPPALEMVEVLRKNGNSVDIIYARYTGATPAEKDYDTALTFEIIENGGKVRRLLKHLYLAASFKKLQAQKKTDVVIACDILALQALATVNTSAKTGYWCFEEPLSKNMLSLEYYRVSRLSSWINKLSFLIMPSPTREKWLKNKFGITIPSVVIYNCRQYKHEERKGLQGIPPFDTLCAYTGKISSTQYVDEIIGAIARQDNGTGLAIAGPADAEYYEQLKAKVNADENLKQRVIFLGRITRDEVYDLIAMSDIGFVLYGLDMNGQEIDPAPNKLGDYIAGESWVIGSGQEYLKYWLHGKGAGVCVDEINSHTLAAAIETISKDPQFSDKSVLRKLYQNELNMNVQGEKLEKLISTL